MGRGWDRDTARKFHQFIKIIGDYTLTTRIPQKLSLYTCNERIITNYFHQLRSIRVLAMIVLFERAGQAAPTRQIICFVGVADCPTCINSPISLKYDVSHLTQMNICGEDRTISR